jgi:hypothetical protein
MVTERKISNNTFSEKNKINKQHELHFQIKSFMITEIKISNGTFITEIIQVADSPIKNSWAALYLGWPCEGSMKKRFNFFILFNFSRVLRNYQIIFIMSAI